MGLFPFTFTTARNVLLSGDGTGFYLLRINFGSWWNTFDTIEILGRWVFASEPQTHSLVTSCMTIHSGRGGTAVSSSSIFDFLLIIFVPPSIRTRSRRTTRRVIVLTRQRIATPSVWNLKLHQTLGFLFQAGYRR